MPPERNQRVGPTADLSCWKRYSEVCVPCRIRKVRCGRERPHCANCVRTGQECSWTEEGKKRNQTTLLSNDLGSLWEHVQELEGKIGEIQDWMERMNSSPLIMLTPSTFTLQGSEATHFSVDDPSQSPILPPSGVHSRRRLKSRCIIDPVSGLTHYLSPTSLEALKVEAQDLLIPYCEPLGSHELGLLDEKLRSLFVQELNLEPQSDGLAPAPPPVEILKAMQEVYFSFVQPYFPVWTVEEVENLVSSLNYTKAATNVLARDVCANNLVLLTLDARALHSIPDNTVERSATARTCISDADFTKPYIANAKRAVQNIACMLLPSLINVQALVSLALVAQRHFTPNLFRHVVGLAGQVAASIGLFQRASLAAESEAAEDNCMRTLSYCLVILDKAASWITGTPPGISAHLISISDKTTTEPSVQDAGNLIRRTKLACIEEKIYTGLYLEKSGPENDEEFHQVVHELHQDLHNWAAESDLNLDPDGRCTTSEIGCFYAARILIKWLLYPFRAEIDVSMMGDMRKYILSIIQLWDTNSHAGQRASVARLLASYPCIAPLGLAVSIIRGQSEKNDAHLLQRFQQILRAMAKCSEETSHIVRLYQFVSLLVDYTTVVPQIRRRQDSLFTAEHGQYTPNVEPVTSINSWMEQLHTDEAHPLCLEWVDLLSPFIWSEGQRSHSSGEGEENSEVPHYDGQASLY